LRSGEPQILGDNNREPVGNCQRLRMAESQGQIKLRDKWAKQQRILIRTTLKSTEELLKNSEETDVIRCPFLSLSLTLLLSLFFSWWYWGLNLALPLEASPQSFLLSSFFFFFF
jgi:hypothetical protein